MFSDLLKTQRLVLRLPAKCDVESIADLMNNWNVVSRIALAPYPYELSDAEEFVERVSQRQRTADDAVYAITKDTSFLGVISVAPQRRGPNIGYWLGEPYWGQGLMTEAVGAVVHEFFMQPVNQSLISGFFRGNQASWSIQRKFGFEVTGESTIMCVARNAEIANVETELSRQRFEEVKS
ncbi:MAG: RimJ/RimL family protein N-acetyltransferase [Hyphomicrobiaceae bacterium]|jgi:RimJ/RimL family protein N-acetyltransferase